MQKAHLFVIMLPCMSNKYLCPVTTLCLLFESQPFHPCDPVIKTRTGVLVETHLRRRLQLVLSMLSLPTESLTYHALRHSGASLTFNNHVDFEAVKSQGAWNSNTVYKYLFANSSMIQQVPTMFQQLEHSIGCLGQ